MRRAERPREGNKERAAGVGTPRHGHPLRPEAATPISASSPAFLTLAVPCADAPNRIKQPRSNGNGGGGWGVGVSRFKSTRSSAKGQQDSAQTQKGRPQRSSREARDPGWSEQTEQGELSLCVPQILLPQAFLSTDPAVLGLPSP